MNPLLRHAGKVAASAISRLPVSSRSLAEPPPGSGLKPLHGDSGPPIVGYALNIVNDLLGTARVLNDRYGPVFWVDGFGTRVVVVCGQEGIGEVLGNRDKAFANSGWEYFLGSFFRRGIMLLDFDEHMLHRRIMQQAFARQRLVEYLDIMNPAIERALDGWTPRSGFPMYTTAKQLTLDIATEVFVGTQLGAEADELHDAFTATVEGGLAVVRADVPGGRWNAGLRGRKVLEDYFIRQIPEKRADPGTDMFSVLCGAVDETGARFSDDDIVNHMIFLLMAAHDTTTTTVAMMAYYLAKHPEWQDRVRAESRSLNKTSIGYDDVDLLPSLDLVMKESLRMCSPVGMLARETVTDTSILGQYVPAGTKVGLMVSASHRMQPWWTDPDTFDPERFAEHRREDKAHRTAFAPFGGGAHKCIGMHFGAMEVKAILHQMLLRFSWTVPAGYEPPMGFLTGPYPSDGLPIRIERLNADAASRSIA